MQSNHDVTCAAFSESAKSFLTDIATPVRLKAMQGTTPGFDLSVWRAVCEQGWTSILVREESGGLALNLDELCAITEQIGQQPLPEPFIAAGVQSVVFLEALPSSPLRDALLQKAMAGDAIVGLAWQEHAGELSPSAPITKAVSSECGKSRLEGRKQFVVPGAGLSGWLVLADGPSVHWLEADAAGVQVQTSARVDGSWMASVAMKDAPAQWIWSGPEVTAALERANAVARIAQAAELLGMARCVLNMTLEHLKTRVQFDKPIGSNQALQHRAVDAFIQVELAAACLKDILKKHREQSHALDVLASRVKARCAEVALMTTRFSMQMHGAIGFTEEFNLGIYWKRVLHSASWLGNASAHRERHFELTSKSKQSTVAEVSSSDVLTLSDMTDWESLPESEFRQIVRDFLQNNHPPELRNSPQRLHWEDVKHWYFSLSKQGWIAPSWPKAHGGMELSPSKLLAFIEEFEDFGALRLPDQGLINLGPLLIKHGTPEQREQWLPKIITGENIWCQGYSEPNAGSDLSSLRTSAVEDGDDFLVNGQKIWTTLAQDATHIFMLVRTDKNVKKQNGISFLLADLKTPGITVRPIRNIAGEEEFCEVFFDDARIPKKNLVGGLNQGWSIAKALLGFERIFIGSPKTSQKALGLLHAVGQQQNAQIKPDFWSKYSALELDVLDLCALYTEFADVVRRGETLPPSVSLLKIWATETYARISAQLVESAEEAGGTREKIPGDGISFDPVSPLLSATVTTIYGGANEIQRNLLARYVLALPQ